MATITLDPATRLEGHLKVQVENSAGRVTSAKSSGMMFRGFENLLIGKDPRDAVQITQRVCGVCPISHAMASSLAIEAAAGLQVTSNARIIRNLILGSNYIQSHILQQQARFPEATGALSWVLSAISISAKMIAAQVRRARLEDVLGSVGAQNVQGETQQKLDVIANEILMRNLGGRQGVAVVASEENEQAVILREGHRVVGWVDGYDPYGEDAYVPVLAEPLPVAEPEEATAPDGYAHIILDEAQDLSPMECRMIARPSSESLRTGSILSPSPTTADRSRRSPFTRAAIADRSWPNNSAKTSPIVVVSATLRSASPSTARGASSSASPAWGWRGCPWTARSSCSPTGPTAA